LCHCAVERDGRGLLVGAVEHTKPQIPGRRIKRLAAGIKDLRCVHFDKVEHGCSLEQEDASVPIKATSVEIFLRRLERGLLNETLYLAVDRIAWLGLDVAIAGMWRVRLNTEGDECAYFGRRYAAFYCAGKSGRIGDHVVRRRKKDERIWIGARGDQRRDARGRP